ncbi:ATP-binding protein [Zhouia sp. PK063]|uniref:sensor histidine kinase n=1 Tax=Zhouia sp. PK063 TaxID=3373602 RepID=UPI00379B7871
MKTSVLGKYKAGSQAVISFAIVSLVTLACYFSVNFIGGYHVVAIILLMVVSILATIFDIVPVILAAVLSAIVWNFFFIPPIYTFQLDNPEDLLMFLMYFVVALLHTVLTFKIRDFQKKAREKEEREQTIRLYNTLLNSLSHELRTPIATIIGSVDTIRDQNLPLSENNKNELLSEINIAALRLNRQVENLLNMSRLEAKILKPKLDWCDIEELLQRILNELSDALINHQIELQLPEKPLLYKIDQGFIAQVIYNILYNAKQYTPPQTHIVIQVQPMENVLKIKISDNGPGFPEDEIPLVFDKFYRLHSSKSGGTGLGLSIVKGFVEALNGTVSLRNNRNGGASFYIEIPAETLPFSDHIKA